MLRYLIFSVNLALVWCGASRVKYDYYVHNRSANESTRFSYTPESPNSPANWHNFAADCGGRSQSPINIETKTIKFWKRLGEVKVTKWTEKPISITVNNNGYTLGLGFTYEDVAHPIIILNKVIYELHHLHFHFGLNRSSGSEHYINSRAYAMESHAVFYNRAYDTFEEALNHTDGLAVIGRLYDQIQTRFVINMNFGFLQRVRNPDDTYTINATDVFTLKDIMGPLNSPYYMYYGSLTTPGCNEVATWLVGAKPLRISCESLDQFRKLNGYEGLMAPNFRPLQKLNGRIVRRGGRIFL